MTVEAEIAALCEFQDIECRLEVRGSVNGVTVYDDSLITRRPLPAPCRANILVLLEPRSNTMKMAVHRERLGASLQDVDRVWLRKPHDPGRPLHDSLVTADMWDNNAVIVQEVVQEARAGDSITTISNDGFGGIHEKLLMALEEWSDKVTAG